jgi:hypothetical protein
MVVRHSDHVKEPLNCTFERVNFMVCKLYLNFLEKMWGEGLGFSSAFSRHRPQKVVMVETFQLMRGPCDVKTHQNKHKTHRFQAAD